MMKKIIIILATSLFSTSMLATAYGGSIGKNNKSRPNTCALTSEVHNDGCCSVFLPSEQGSSSQRGICEDNNVIDVLWVYTSEALLYIGNEEGVLEQCQIAVDDANATFANTGLPFSVQIVGLHYTDYLETDDYLLHLQNPNDGFMDEVHPLRDAKAADIVVLITENGYCGLAYVSPANAAYGFQGCSAGCLVADWAQPFRHELGHNLGSQHYTTDTYGYFSWSSGHRLIPEGGEEIGTTMGGNNIPHYSNPNIYYGGVPTGYPIGPDEEADNFAAFTVTVPMVADFRCSESACHADVNANGSIDVNDLLEVIDSWGPCASCPADILVDGYVDVSDLLIVVGNWGPCE